MSTRHTGKYNLTMWHRVRVPAVLAVALATAAVAPPEASAASIAEAFAPRTAASAARIDHSAWDKLLKTYVVPSPDGINRVDYAKFKAAGHGALKQYLAGLQKADPASLGRSEQFAFWANLYNARTIDVVLDKYPVKSIKDISLGGGLLASITGGPWKAKVVKVKGMDLSLDDIEHAILRALFKDPRVHYAVNCASLGCPNLMTEAFTGEKLDAQLDAGAKAYVNHPRGISVAGGKVKASSIYNWFQADFGGSGAGVIAHARKYASPALKQQLEGITVIAEFDYDWRLNETRG